MKDAFFRNLYKRLNNFHTHFNTQHIKKILIPQATLLITVNMIAHITPNGPFQLRVKIKLSLILIFFVLYLEGLIPAIYFNNGRHPYRPLLFSAIVTLERVGLGQVMLKKNKICVTFTN